MGDCCRQVGKLTRGKFCLADSGMPSENRLSRVCLDNIVCIADNRAAGGDSAGCFNSVHVFDLDAPLLH